MDERELVSFLKACGWTLHKRKRNKGVQYLYAARRKGTKVKERYIAPFSRLEELTEEFITNKLQQQGNGPNVAAAIECYIPTKVCCHSIA